MILSYFHQYIPKGQRMESESLYEEHVELFKPYCRFNRSVLFGGSPGFEMVTLKQLQEDLAGIPDDQIIFYSHTKGISKEGSERRFSDAWRQSMQSIILDAIENKVEFENAYGGFLLQKDHFNFVPNFGNYDYFGGNFWLAKAGFLKTLPPIDVNADRFFAERWIGMTGAKLDSPNPNDWPSYAAFYRVKKQLQI